MRPLLHGDVEDAARAAFAVPEPFRRRLILALLGQASAADRYRKRFGRAHPTWGNGSLMSAARRRGLFRDGSLEDAGYCRCLALVFDVLVEWRARQVLQG